MKRISTLFAACGILLAVSATSLAQEATPHPLMQLLDLVPDVPAAFENVPAVGYIDYAALEASRPGVGVFASGADFAAAREAQDEGVGIWMANMNRLITGPQGLANATFAGGAETRELVGFDMFDVNQGLTYGVPPGVANIMLGDFDNAAIVAAYEARDYAVTQNDGVVLLQRADGEPGFRQDLANANRAIPFGGDLGRQEPIALLDGLILNSADDATVQQMVASATGNQRSLLSRASMVAAAEALTSGEAILLQAAFLDPADVAIAPPNFALFMQPLATPPTEEQLEEMLDPSAPEGYGPLPFYTMSVMADMQLDGDQVATIALVYDDEADAELAAAEMAHRLSIFRDTISRRDEIPLIDMVEGARVADAEVFTSSNGKYVALASVLYPTPENIRVDMLTGEPVTDDEQRGSYIASGRVIRYWMSSLYARAFDVLYVTEAE